MKIITYDIDRCMSSKRSNFRWKHDTTPTVIYVYVKIVIPPKTLVRGKPLFFFHPLSYRHRCRTTCHSANRYGTLSIYFCFFLFPHFFFLPVVVDCEFNLSQGLRRAETGNCGVLPNRIVNPTNRTGDDGVVVAVKEIATKRWLTHVMHCTAAVPHRRRNPTVSPFVHNNIFHFEIFQGSDNYLGWINDVRSWATVRRCM